MSAFGGAWPEQPEQLVNMAAPVDHYLAAIRRRDAAAELKPEDRVPAYLEALLEVGLGVLRTQIEGGSW